LPIRKTQGEIVVIAKSIKENPPAPHPEPGKPPAPPRNLAAYFENDGLHVTWEAVPDADHYHARFMGDDTAFGDQIIKYSETSAVFQLDTGYNASSYQVQVAAGGNDNWSAYSELSLCQLSRPTVNIANGTDSGLDLNMDVLPWTRSIEMEFLRDGRSIWKFSLGCQKTYTVDLTDERFAPAGAYAVTVRLIHILPALSSDWSQYVSWNRPEAPQKPEAVWDGVVLRLYWQAARFGALYEVNIRNDGKGRGRERIGITTTNFSLSLPFGYVTGACTFQVRALSNGPVALHSVWGPLCNFRITAGQLAACAAKKELPGVECGHTLYDDNPKITAPELVRAMFDGGYPSQDAQSALPAVFPKLTQDQMMRIIRKVYGSAEVWSPFEIPDNEARKVFAKAFKKLADMSYKPLLVTRQLVNSKVTNFIFLANVKLMRPDSVPYSAFVRICNDATGAKVVGIVQHGSPAHELAGGYSAFKEISEKERGVLSDALKGFSDSGFDAKYVSSQAGTGYNYKFAGTKTMAMKNPVKYPAFLTVYAHFSGKPVITGIENAFDIV
jgi:hypothetical protein